MSVDKLVDSTQLDADLTSVANAIRTKGGTSASLAFPADFVSAIQAIPSGGGGDDNLKKLITNTLTSFSDSDITEIPAYTFYGKTELTNISIPNVIKIKDSAFYGTGLYGYLRLDKVTDVTGNGLHGTKITGLELPALNWISWGPIFRSSSLLEKVRLGISSTALGGTYTCGDSWFRDCPKMDTLIIGYTNRILALGGVAAFNNTPFASGGTGGTLYVPQSMIASYESNTNWSTILSYTNNQIRSIEGSAYENYYFDGTPIT